MKKLISILILSALVVVISAQSTLLTKTEQTISDPAWVYNWKLSTVDSLGAVQDSIIYPMFINTSDSIRFHVNIKITEITSPANVSVKVRGYNFKNQTPTDLATARYYGVGTDTTFSRSVPNYNFYDVLFIRNANKARVSNIGVYYKKKN